MPLKNDVPPIVSMRARFSGIESTSISFVIKPVLSSICAFVFSLKTLNMSFRAVAGSPQGPTLQPAQTFTRRCRRA